MMHNQVKTKSESIRLIFVILCLAFIPANFVYQGLSYIEEKENLNRRETTIENLLAHKHRLGRRLNSYEFLEQSFRRVFRASNSADDCKILLHELFDSEKLRFDYAIWNKDETLNSSTFVLQLNESERQIWQRLPTLFRVFATDSKARAGVYHELRSILGSSFFLNHRAMSENYISASIYIFSSDTDAPLYFIARKRSFTLLIRIDPQKLAIDEMVKAYFSRRETAGIYYALFSNSEQKAGNLTDKAFAAKVVEKYSARGDVDYFEIAGRIIAVVKTALQSPLFIVSEPLGAMSSASTKSLGVFVFLFLCLLIAGGFLGVSLSFANFSIVSQTIIFVFIAAGIPVAVLVGNGIDFYQSREVALIHRKAKEMSEYLQTIDRRSEAYLGHLSNTLDMNLSGLKDVFNSVDSDLNVADFFEQILSTTSYNDFVVMNLEKDKIISKAGWVRFDGDKAVETHKNIDDNSRNNISYMWPLGRVYLSMLNSEDNVKPIADETALLIETFFLKPYRLVVADFVSFNDRILKVGFGGNLLYSYFKVLGLKADTFFDTFVIGSFADSMINKGYADRIIDGIQRNPFGMKVFVSFANEIWPMRKSIEQLPDELPLLEIVTNQYDSAARLVTYLGEQWVFSGFECRFLDGFVIWGLYPLKSIQDTVKGELVHLLMILALTIFMVVSLMLIFYLNLIRPVRQLNSGAKALEQRDFNYRINNSAADEFGEMAQIFNQSIEDFEELHIASLVQARLFPRQMTGISGISLYARTVPMAELGGDYHDYFEISDNKLGLMLGDVAGHGVGASLIMAMAKAGVICSNDRLNDPAALLKGLHALVRASRSRKQRKIMTFQYACINCISGRGVYSNAGGCNPIVVSPITSLSRELVAVGAPLGAFKKADYTNVDFQLMPGEALVFYTDGVVEAVDGSGKEIGYDNFKKIVSESYSSDAKTYYNNIYNRYLQWIHNSAVQDDVSILVMVYQPLVLNLKKH